MFMIGERVNSYLENWGCSCVLHPFCDGGELDLGNFGLNVRQVEPGRREGKVLSWKFWLDLLQFATNGRDVFVFGTFGLDPLLVAPCCWRWTCFPKVWTGSVAGGTRLMRMWSGFLKARTGCVAGCTQLMTGWTWFHKVCTRFVAGSTRLVRGELVGFGVGGSGVSDPGGRIQDPGFRAGSGVIVFAFYSFSNLLFLLHIFLTVYGLRCLLFILFIVFIDNGLCFYCLFQLFMVFIVYCL